MHACLFERMISFERLGHRLELLGFDGIGCGLGDKIREIISSKVLGYQDQELISVVIKVVGDVDAVLLECTLSELEVGMNFIQILEGPRTWRRDELH